MQNITANKLWQMVKNAAARLAKKSGEINDLNVFPVPDGDTGSNMSMTLSGISNYHGDTEMTVGTVSKSLADCMLRAARGNSGVILSVFFRGFAKGLKGMETADAKALTGAFAKGCESAYGAVMNPTEGTILSVIRSAAESAQKLLEADPNATVDALFDNICAASRVALDHTPEQLPILKQAGLVDAGGYGFLVIVKGMREALPWEEDRDIEAAQAAIATEGKSAAALCDTEIVNPYCTECIVEKNETYAGEDKAGAFREFAYSMGDSVVFVEDEGIIKVHVHTKDPGRVLSEALRYGSLMTIKVENMRRQHTELSNTPTEKVVAPLKKPLSKPYAIVAVGYGEGILSIFSDLGVDRLVVGGQTMNPSTEQLVDAIESTEGKTVILLPNNHNVILVAEQAAALYKEGERRVVVVPTRTIPQGVTALCSFDESLSPEENAENMTAAISGVVTLSMTRAVRDAEVDSIHIKKDQFLGLRENKVKEVDDSLTGCLSKLLPAVADRDAVTVYFGADLNEAQIAEITALVEAACPDSENIFVNGGQPVYSLIVAGE